MRKSLSLFILLFLSTWTFVQSQDLPYKVDNSKTKYFRPIHNQHRDGSCANVSGITYNFAYEINQMRDLSGKELENQYPAYFTWNFLNDGYLLGTFFYDASRVAMSSGVPTVLDADTSVVFYKSGQNDDAKYNAEYEELNNDTTLSRRAKIHKEIAIDTEYKDYSKWLSGYDTYYRAMHNKVENFYFIDPSTPAGLQTLKQWMYNHGNGSANGGICNFSSWYPLSVDTLPEGTEDAGKTMIKEWSHSSGHAMTFVGYNDSVRLDINKDGRYTNDIDITGDSIVDMKDWEIGALIMANSFGTDWQNDGYSYSMYRALALDQLQGGIGDEHRIFILKPKENYRPLLTMKVKIEHNSRKDLNVFAGISSDINADKPEHTLLFEAFRNKGGDLPMQNDNQPEIEIGLDITPLLNKIESGKEVKIFLNIDSDGGEGKIISYSVLNYIKDETNPIEIKCQEENKTIDSSLVTRLSLNTLLAYQSPVIVSNKVELNAQLEADKGAEPYIWSMVMDYNETNITKEFPAITKNEIIPKSDVGSVFDDGFAHVDLPFEFPFYNKTYKRVSVSSNGFISLLDNPEGISLENVIAPFGADLAVNYKNPLEGMWYEGDENSITFRWKTSMTYSQTVYVDVATTLYPNGEIEILFNTDSTDNDIYLYSGINNGFLNQQYNKYTHTADFPKNYAYKLTPAANYITGINVSESGIVTRALPIEEDVIIKMRVKDAHDIITEKEITLSADNNQLLMYGLIAIAVVLIIIIGRKRKK